MSMMNLDERAEQAFLRRLSVSDMIYLIADQAKALKEHYAESVANGGFICKQRNELKEVYELLSKANARVEELEKALLKVNNILFDLEINTDKEISGKNIAPVRQVIKQALQDKQK